MMRLWRVTLLYFFVCFAPNGAPAFCFVLFYAPESRGGTAASLCLRFKFVFLTSLRRLGIRDGAAAQVSPRFYFMHLKARWWQLWFKNFFFYFLTCLQYLGACNAGRSSHVSAFFLYLFFHNCGMPLQTGAVNPCLCCLFF